MLRNAAELWLAGAAIDWTRRYAGERRIKCVLPTYPFERRRYWIVEQQQSAAAAGASPLCGPGARLGLGPGGRGAPNISWRPSPGGACNIQVRAAGAPKRGEPHWLLFNPTAKIDKQIAAALRERGGKVTVIEKGAKYKTFADGRVALDPNVEADLAQACKTVIKALSKRQRLQVVYFCEPTPDRKPGFVEARYREDIDDKLKTPIVLMRSLMQAGKPDNVTITFVTREGQEISGSETVNPTMAMPIGPCLAGMSEYPGLRCRIFDIPAAVANADELAQRVAADLAGPAPSSSRPIVVTRAGREDSSQFLRS